MSVHWHNLTILHQFYKLQIFLFKYMTWQTKYLCGSRILSCYLSSKFCLLLDAYFFSWQKGFLINLVFENFTNFDWGIDRVLKGDVDCGVESSIYLNLTLTVGHPVVATQQICFLYSSYQCRYIDIAKSQAKTCKGKKDRSSYN